VSAAEQGALIVIARCAGLQSRRRAGYEPALRLIKRKLPCAERANMHPERRVGNKLATDLVRASAQRKSRTVDRHYGGFGCRSSGSNSASPRSVGMGLHLQTGSPRDLPIGAPGRRVASENLAGESRRKLIERVLGTSVRPNAITDLNHNLPDLLVAQPELSGCLKRGPKLLHSDHYTGEGNAWGASTNSVGCSRCGGSRLRARSWQPG
jgi:hypothetical protein